MSLPEGAFPSVPFSLACEGCDGGMEIGTYEEAVAGGWTEIVFAPNLLTANYLGLCPECRRREEEEQLQRGRISPPGCD